MLKSIIVAIDGTDLCERVIQFLNELQVQPTTKFILSHVIPPPVSDLEMLADRPHIQAEEVSYRHIEKLMASYQDKLPGKSELEIVTGDPSEEIIRLANIHQADLIVIGSRGLIGVKRIIQGSVSSQVVENAPCSVIVVK